MTRVDGWFASRNRLLRIGIFAGPLYCDRLLYNVSYACYMHWVKVCDLVGAHYKENFSLIKLKFSAMNSHSY